MVEKCQINLKEWGSDIWYQDYFEYAEYEGDNLFFCFSLEVTFFGKFGPTNQKFLFKLEFGT